jgi:hypothetical protein
MEVTKLEQCMLLVVFMDSAQLSDKHLIVFLNCQNILVLKLEFYVLSGNAKRLPLCLLMGATLLPISLKGYRQPSEQLV